MNITIVSSILSHFCNINLVLLIKIVLHDFNSVHFYFSFKNRQIDENELILTNAGIFTLNAD